MCLPGLHSSQLDLAMELWVWPGLHVEHTVSALAGENSPAAQAVHPEAPELPEMSPAEQAEHGPALPLLAMYLPGLHSRQEDSAAPDWYVPAAHLVHTVVPVAPAYQPTAHAEQDVWPAWLCVYPA